MALAAEHTATPPPRARTRQPARSPPPPPPLPACTPGPSSPPHPLSFFTGCRRHRGGLPQPPTGGRLADEGTPPTRWGSRPCPPFPLLHASWRCMSHTSLPARHATWPRVALVPSPHPCLAPRDRTGGANGPWMGPPEPWTGPQEPQCCYSDAEGGVTSRRAVTRDAEPPPVPHPCWGGAARTCGSSPRRPCNAIRAVQAARSAERPRTAPSAPPPPPPTQAGARGLAAPGGLLCRGGEATGRFIPTPNWGLCPRHRAQTPVGGYHTTTHRRTTGTRER